MIFQPYLKAVSYAPTPRKIATFERRKIAEQNALPLLADMVAADQLSADAEMARRAVQWDAQTIASRAQVAARWRRVRARYHALPEHIRRVVRLTWERYSGPKDTNGLSALIWRVSAEHGASPSDFAHLAPEERLAMTADLNDKARQDDPWTRCTRAFSPEALLWLSPGWEASAEYPSPVLHLHTSHSRYMQLWHAIADYADFGHNADPSGERSRGVVVVGGVTFRFQILYRRPKSNAECPTPWNADLSRRVLFVSIEGEFAFYADEGAA